MKTIPWASVFSIIGLMLLGFFAIGRAQIGNREVKCDWRGEAEESQRELEKSASVDKSIVTAIAAFKEFYRTEDYDRDDYEKNLIHRKFHRLDSGRDQLFAASWGNTMNDPNTSSTDTANAEQAAYVKPADAELKERLTPLQYHVTQEEGTEPPFQNEYWDNHREGIYVDIVSGEPLFSSLDKFDSGTGWPSFTRPLEPENITTRQDTKLLYSRTEVRSKHGNSHLGHVFNDGPPPTGLRYCMNSAALRFIPIEDMGKEGYAKYLKLFQQNRGSPARR